MSKLIDITMPKRDKKLMFGIVIGSTLEYFDFMTFIFIAPIITELFFPKSHHILAILSIYTAVTFSYLFRPIGGIWFGYLGDKYGRRTIFYLALLLMAIPSFIIGILPTFSKIGYFATIFIILLRIAQGISLGAEVPASVTYISENYRHKNYFFYCSWLTFGANLGIVMSSQFIRVLANNTSNEFMHTYGWRIPFFSAGILAIIGFYLRKNAFESIEFRKIQKMKKISYSPIKDLWAGFSPQILCGISICLLVSLSTSVFLIFLPNILTTYYSIKLSVSANITSIGSLSLAIFSVYFAYLTKYINPAKIINFSIMTLLIILLIIFLFRNNSNFLSINFNINLYLLTMLISISIAGINGLFFGLLSDMFPTQVRFSGIAFCYNIAYVIGAGLTPLWTSLLLILKNGYFYVLSIVMIIIMLIFFTFKANAEFESYGN